MASFLRGEIERERGNEQSALEAYGRAVVGEGLENAAARQARFAAAKQAGVILFSRQDPSTARDLFAIAAGAEDGEQRARGACMLAMCERQLGNRAAAIAAFETVLSTPDAPADVRDMARRAVIEMR